MASAQTCWAISDGAAGNERQALALAEALGGRVQVWRVAPRPPWSWCAPHLLAGAALALPPAQRTQFAAPWPDWVIGCGRAAALYTRALRRWSGQGSFCVQILDPRRDPRDWDAVVTPGHDTLRGGNVIHTLGSLHPVDAEWLAAGAAAWAELATLPHPRTTVLIGASHREVAVDLGYCVGLVERLAAAHANAGGSFLVSTSRRTPPALRDWLRSAFARFPGRFFGGSEDGANPYAGFLAHADRVVVTPDSVNMLSEACAVGVPVYAWLPQPARGKLGRFHAALVDAGHLRLLGVESSVPRAAAPLRETAAVAARLHALRRARA